MGFFKFIVRNSARILTSLKFVSFIVAIVTEVLNNMQTYAENEIKTAV